MDREEKIIKELRKEFGKTSYHLKEELEEGEVYVSKEGKEYLVVDILSTEGRMKFLMTELTVSDDYKKEEIPELFRNKESIYVKVKNGLTTRQNVTLTDVVRILGLTGAFA